MAHVLLIEPDRLLADTYRRAIEASGNTVVMCASAQSAIYAADEVLPDVVVLELQLIGHSGIEFLYEFRSYGDWRSIPVIVHSQVPSSEFSGSWGILSRELMIKDYHYKPITTLKILLRSINDCLPATVEL